VTAAAAVEADAAAAAVDELAARVEELAALALARDRLRRAPGFGLEARVDGRDVVAGVARGGGAAVLEGAARGGEERENQEDCDARDPRTGGGFRETRVTRTPD
jgi:hypothetical protein